MVYDAAIIGTGPAGVSAALTLKANDKQFLWIGSRDFSDKILRAERIANYPGLSMVTGPQMGEAFRHQCQKLGLEILDRMVNSIVQMGDTYAVMAGEDFYQARTLLLATGVTAVGTLPGEEELLGRGVSYCATCDGNLYRGKTIAIVCTHRRFEGEVDYLARLAAKVYYLPLYQEPGIALPNVEYLSQRIVRVQGEQGRLRAILLKGGEEIPVDGLFCLRESVSLSTLLPGLVTSQGHIVVDRQMATNLPGCFAAGDCTGRPYQYVKAAGEGNVAAHSMVEYLARSQE
ncbi:MAG: NAD(P)/FAD-dependent oxidoreductase [Acutalibacter sp.]|jgi:thioredoxin reductase (NADPH)